MMRTCVVIFAVLAVISARPDWGNFTSEPYPPTAEPGPLERLKEALVNLGNKAEELAFNAKYRVEDEAVDFAGEVEDSVVERIEGLADLIEDINDEHLDY